MHGLGNDFVVIDGMTQKIMVTELDVPKWSHRHTGIGFDQLLFIESSEKADFSCRFFNSDGSEAEQCGNGVRCAARYVYEKKLVDKAILRIETLAGIVNVTIHDYEHIEVQLGVPRFAANKQLVIGEEKTPHDLFVLSVGNPHAIMQVDSVKQVPIQEIGREVATHSIFPDGVNVGFMQIINPRHIMLRTYERGVGETLACGSNACASVAAGVFNRLLEQQVKVELALGSLQVEWLGEGHPLVMTGPAAIVFEGFLCIP